jgi:hypothetical protein
MTSEINPFQGLNDIKDEPKKEKKTKKKPRSREQNIFEEDILKLIDKPVKSKKEPKGNKGPAKERAQLIYKLKTYKNNKRLGPKLKDADFNMSESYYNKLSVGDLNLELEKYDMELSRNGLCDMINHGFKAGLKISENVITQKTKLNVVGTCDKLFDDDNFLDLFERVKLKYNLGFVGQMDPLLEMSLVIFQTGLMVHGTNKFRSEIETKINLDEEYNENENIEEEE